MKRCAAGPAILLASLLLTLPASSQSSQANAAKSRSPAAADEREIIRAARDRANAVSNHDCQTWASHVADDFRDIEAFGGESHETLLEGCKLEAEATSGCKSERELSNFHFRTADNLVIADYTYKVTERCGDYAFPTPHHQVDAYEKRGGQWIALFCAEIPQVQDPPAEKIDAAILDEYTGEYAWVGAKMVDTVTRKGDKLYIQTTGDAAPTELVPQSRDTFFIRGSLNRDTFVRDQSGKVAGNRGYSADYGGGYRATKTK